MDILHEPPTTSLPELNEPFDTRLRLLLEWERAKKAHLQAQVLGKADEAYALSWKATDAHQRLDEHAEHLGNALILTFRLAGRHLTAQLTAALLDLPFFQQLSEGHDDLQARVADLESVVGGAS